MREKRADGEAVAGHSPGRAVGKITVDDRFAALREVVSGQTDSGQAAACRN